MTVFFIVPAFRALRFAARFWDLLPKILVLASFSAENIRLN